MSDGPRPTATPDDESVPDGTGSNEMFYTDDNGEKQDSDLHEELFAGGAEDDEANLALQAALEDGMDPELAQSLWG